MAKVYHSSIFYPNDKDELLKLTAPLEKKDPKRAIIVPHQDMRKCYKAYQEAFRYIPDFSRIIALLPIHSERLIKDDGKIIFQGDDEITTPLGTIYLEDLGIERANYYQEEEYSSELILPFVQTSCPHSTLALLYVKAENSEETKRLSHLIEKWNNANTFFIISSNLTAKLQERELEKEKTKAIEMLENGDRLLDSYRKGHIKICASPIIDALSRVISGKWKLIYNIDDTITGHAAFYKD